MAKKPVGRDDEAPWNTPGPGRAREPEPRETLVSWRALMIGAGVALAIAALILFGVRFLVARDNPAATAGGEPELITAPAEPWRTPAPAGPPAGEGIDESVFATGDGDDPIGEIALGREPESDARPEDAPTDLLPPDEAAEDGDAALASGLDTGPAPRPPGIDAQPTVPVIRPRPPAPRADPAPPPQAEPAPNAGPTAALQLGAFATRAAADTAWRGFSARFAYLAGLEKSVEPIERDGQTLYRLRAEGVPSAARARDLCARLAVAGETCLVAR